MALLTFKQRKDQETLNKLKSKKDTKQENNYVKFVVQSFALNSKPIAPLGPTLGQFNVNLVEFCTKFNSETKDFAKDLNLSVTISKKLKSKDFLFNLKNPTLKTLFEILLLNFYETDEIENIENVINIELIFDLIILFSFFNNNLTLKKSANQVFSYLLSYNSKFIINF